jgi:hypothetical protein
MMATGVKGSDVYTSTGSALVDLSIKLVRGADEEEIKGIFRGLVDSAKAEEVADACVLMFHTRDVRGGKGERDLFKALFSELAWRSTSVASRLKEFIPEYGSWQDVVAMMSDDHVDVRIRMGLRNMVASQLREDVAKEEGKSISLAAKWAPREGKSTDKEARALATIMYPLLPRQQQMATYRRLVAGLNRRLKTMETFMAGGHWADIEPSAVPGRAGKLYSRALLNLVGTAKKGETIPHAKVNTLRHPDDADRMACREHFIAHFAAAKEGKATVHGADTLFPHEIVKKAYGVGGDLADSERSQMVAVWRSMVEKAHEGGGLKRSIFMSDFSGSMQSAGAAKDTPYWVSMALGMLGAEISEGPFKNRLMTFDSTPRWHTFPDGGDLFARLETLGPHIGQGTSTDFQAAMELVLADLKRNRVRPGEEPENLIVLTDMGWDQACGSYEASFYTGMRYRHHVKTAPWETHVEMIRESFKRAGEDMWGVGFKMPRIVIWNLAASYTSEAHATASTPGVAMLAGWSAALFDILQREGPRDMTPLEILRTTLDGSRYKPVRDAVLATLSSST